MTRPARALLMATTAVALHAVCPTIARASDVASPTAAAPQDRDRAASFSVDDELILEVRTDSHILSEGTIGYADPLGAYLPLGELARMLDLAISVDADEGVAEGWILSEDRRFRLDLGGGRIEARGVDPALSPTDAVAREGEIYVRAQVLAKWLPLDVTVDIASLSVRLRPREPFPFEQRMERERARSGLGATMAGRPEFAFEPTPWLLWSPPAIDVQARQALESGAATSAYDLRASGDLLWMGADVFAAGDDEDGLSSLRATLGRRSSDGDLLGPLRATEFALGDVYSPTLPLAARSMAGLGAYVTNAPIGESSAFEQIDLRGELPLDFEVELYRNDILVGSQSLAVNGRYEFTDVPLEFGLNILRLVFYGPRGEQREEVRRIQVGGGQVPTGELRATLGLIQQGEELFDMSDRDLPGLNDGRWRGAASLEYGLGPNLTASAGAATFAYEGRRVSTAMTGLRGGMYGVAVQADVGWQAGGGSALQVGAAGRLGDWSYAVRHGAFAGDFANEPTADFGGYMSRFTHMRLDGSLRLGDPAAPLSIATSVKAEHESLRGGGSDAKVELRNSAPIGDYLVSNTLIWTRLSRPGFLVDRVDGDGEINGRHGRWTVRAGLGYEIAPDPRLHVVDFALDRRFGESTLVRGFVSQRLTNDRGARFGLSTTRLFENFDLALDAQYDTGDDSYIVGIRIGFSLGWRMPERGLRVARPGLARGGSVAAEVYRDLNGDGWRDASEPGIAGVSFRGASSRAIASDEAGRAFMADMGETGTDVTLDPATLPDPYLAAAREGVRLLPRPGRTHVVQFPVIAVGDAEGQVVFVDDDGERSVASVALRLVDAAGVMSEPARTAYDGHLLFERVRPGTYSLAIDPDQAAALRIELVQPVTVVIGVDGGVSAMGKISVRRAAFQ